MIKDLDLTNKFAELYDKPVVLYGSGGNGKIALKILKEFGIKPEAFCDSNSALKGDIIEGIVVKSLDELLNIAKEKEIVIIITTRSEYYKNIVSILNRNRIQCEQIYTFIGFLYAAYFNLNISGENKLSLLKTVWLHNQKLLRDRMQATIGIHMLLLQNEEDNPPIVVYQPGKVGSSTIASSLEACGTNVMLSYGIVYPALFSGNPVLRQSLVECIKSLKRVKMITLVREPISKDIGHFFQKIDFEESDTGWFVKGLLEKNFQQSFLNYLSVVSPFDFTECNKKETLSKRLICHIDAIGQNNKNGALWGWFDEELKKNFRIDILNEEFDPEKGYSIVEQGNIELLIIKLESLNNLTDVIRDFVGNKNFKILTTNQSETKSYMYAYKQFQEEVILPQEYVDFYYKDNPYTNHFYSERERNAYYEKWKEHIK